ncbi:MAG: leucyl aminopeptidase [Gammaproteobacteria bacterium]|nr:leucyl aminopeptidase [Gammaproteobacteria bacterium]MDH3535200.1 leucyl aminopeptidase [Gammaproteobacteria bacterium]
MEFSLKHTTAETARGACQIITVSQPRKLSASGLRVDRASKGFLASLLKRGDMEGKTGQTLLLPAVPGLAVQRVLLVGCGKESEMNERVYTRVINSIAAALAASGARDAEFYPGDIKIKGRDLAWKVRHAALTLANSDYKFEQMKSGKPEKRRGLQKLAFNTARSDAAKARTAIDEASAISAGMSLARDLGNLPANVCTPGYIARQAMQLAKGEKKLHVKVLDEADMKRLKMGSLLSVSAGSRQPAKLITIEYRGAAAKQQPIALVGKGVTFDTGGISLKPGAAMDEMKFDMCGAASVLGTLKAVNQLQLPINVVGIVPATENMPDGLATKPGDIVTSMSGQTIEILNTDAEGRLILCDALTYAGKFKPRCVIDIATLTGAVIVALGKIPSGVMGNNRGLITDLIKCGEQIEDKIWELPLWDEYQDQLKSNFADMANIGGRDAGTITAACFLSRFTRDYKWAHLDIAGTAWKSGDDKGATGRPVPLLTQYILNQVKK